MEKVIATMIQMITLTCQNPTMEKVIATMIQMITLYPEIHHSCLVTLRMVGETHPTLNDPIPDQTSSFQSCR